MYRESGEWYTGELVQGIVSAGLVWGWARLACLCCKNQRMMGKEDGGRDGKLLMKNTQLPHRPMKAKCGSYSIQVQPSGSSPQAGDDSGFAWVEPSVWLGRQQRPPVQSERYVI